MIDQPASPPLTLVDAQGDKIVLTDLRWPFQQLNAQGVPRELPLASPDVQLVLAALAGQTPGGIPVLVKLNADGSITTSVQQLSGAIFDVRERVAPTDFLLTAQYSIVLGAGASLDLNSLIPTATTRVVSWNGEVSSIGSADVVLETHSGFVFGRVSTAVTGFFHKPFYGVQGPIENGTGNGFLRLRNVSGVAAGGLTGEVIWYVGDGT